LIKSCPGTFPLAKLIFVAKSEGCHYGSFSIASIQSILAIPLLSPKNSHQTKAASASANAVAFAKWQWQLQWVPSTWPPCFHPFRTQSSICPPSTIYRLFELVFVFALLCFALFCCTFGTAAASALDFRFYLTLFAFSPSELTKLIFSQISFGFSLVFLVSLAACEVP